MDGETFRIRSATGVDVALPIAGAGSRAYAFLLDWHIRVLFAGAWFVLALTVLGLPFAIRNPSGTALGAAIVPAIAIYLLYHPVIEMLMRGRTPGKRMAGVRIVTRDGGTPSPAALLTRNVFRLLDGLPAFYLVGLASALATREHLRIGDLAAGTLLVHDGGDDVTALDTLEGLSRGLDHDPALIDLANDLLRRWPELAKDRRAELARSLLKRLGLGPEKLAELPDRDLREHLTLLLRGDR